MLQKTNTNVAPFFDDYDPAKSFHRVLFRPRPIQARELNQLQSILQEQVSRFGQHLFKEGAMVVPGGFRSILDQSAVAITLTTGTIFDITNQTSQVWVRSTATGLIAKVQKTIPAENADPVVLFVEYQNSGSNNTTKAFTNGEALVVYVMSGASQVNVATATATNVTRGMWVKSLEGVYFIRGHFVWTGNQDFVVSKLTTGRNLRVGFNIVEDIVDELADPTLNSNAQGYTNFMGPGASRLRLRLTMASREINDTSNDPNFVEVVRIRDGQVQTQVDTTDYAELMKTIAKRTYEESGDYTVTPFGLDIREHLRTGNNGVFLPVDGGDEAKFVAVVKPGIGYVQGYRTENVGNQNVAVAKARSTAVANNSVTSAALGAYVIGQDLYSHPHLSMTQRVQLRDAGNAQIGTCVVRSIQRVNATQHAVYILDVQMNGGRTFSEVRQLYYAVGSNLWSINLTTGVIFGAAEDRLLYRLPVDVVRSMKPGGTTDTSYSVMRSFDVTTNGSGSASIALNANEVFSAVNDFEWTVSLTGASNAGTVFASTGLSLAGSPVGRSVNIALGAGQANRTIKVTAPVIKTTFIEKTKTLTSHTMAIVLSGESRKNLAHADIQRIVSITDTNSGAVLTDYFKLDNGQRKSWYEVGKITTKDGLTITRNVTVTYQYFAHSSGDYFSVDSYSGLSRTSIPSFDGQNLADFIDFRQLKDASGNFVNTGEIVKPNDSIRADIEYYLPRRDVVYLDQNSNFGVVQGISSLNPTLPDAPAGTMHLYNLSVPAFTEDISKIGVSMIDNRRFTMRDIGSIEKRVSNLEYYTTLSLLETNTNAETIIDANTGNARFKNGFAVEGFTDFSLADTGSLDWIASIDPLARELKPSVTQNVQDLTQNALVNAQKRKDLFTISYTEAVATQQLLATKAVNINPYAVFTWVGKTTLSPASDYWKDVVYNEPVIVNATIDRTNGAVAGTIMNSVWNSWDDVSETRAFAVIGRWAAVAVRTDTTTTTERTDTTTTTKINESIGTGSTDNLINTGVIPYMRSIDIAFTVEKMKPFTRIYPFFDGVNVSSQCRQTGKNYNDPIITDAAGAATGTFTVPSSVDFRFRTGTTMFRFTDSATDGRGVNDFESASQTLFYSGGTLDTRQVEVTNTRTLTASVDVTSSTSQSQTSTSNLSGVAVMLPADPVAQTFRVSEAGGAFVTKVDIAFATKAAAIPVMLQIRTVVAGFPSSDVLPIAEKVLTPAQVTTSANGSAMTSFTFDDPVFLNENQEYAIVLLADTQEYNIYVAQMGQGTLEGQQAVSKQPHIGTFFQSANGSTWSEMQDTDMKFRLWRAVFNTGTASQVTLNGSAVRPLPIKFNALQTTTATNGLIVAEMVNHGLKVGDTIELAGAAAGNGYALTDLNKVHTITAVNGEFISFVTTRTGGTLTNGYTGGGGMTIRSNYAFGLFYSNVAAMIRPGTAISWEYSYRQQSSRSFTAWTRFDPNNTTNLSAEGVVIAPTDFLIRATLSSSRDNLSPVIDAAMGLQTILIEPRIGAGVPSVFKYISKPIRFDNPSNAARFYVTAKLPEGSSMVLQYKLITTSDEDMSVKGWTDLSPGAYVNDSTRFREYTYNLTGAGSFIGYIIRVALYGNNVCDTPALKDIRTIALA